LEALFEKIDEIQAKIANLEHSAHRFESRQVFEHSNYHTALAKIRLLMLDPGIAASLQTGLQRLVSILESNPNHLDRSEYFHVAQTIRASDVKFWHAHRALINRALDLWMNAGRKTTAREGKWDQQAEIARREAAEQRKLLDALWSSIFKTPDEVTREHQTKPVIDPKRPQIQIKEFNLMEAKYKITGGQQGAVGDGATASYFNQVWTTSGTQINLPQLATELAGLRSGLNAQVKVETHRAAANEVALAEQSAKAGDGPRALEHLKKAGAWFWDAATKIGIGVATAAAKTALGL